MARSKSPRVTKSGGTTIVTMPAASAPVARRRRSYGARAGRAVRRYSRGARRRASHFLGARGSLSGQMIGHGVGGFAVGFIEKSFPNLPTIPLIGKKGAIALAAYFLAPKHPLISDIGKAAAAISGYELGSQGHITGDVMGGTVSSQM